MTDNSCNEDFLSFKQFLSTTYGILLRDHQQQIITVKLSNLFERLGIHDLHELMMRITQSNESSLRAAVIEAVTINETSWRRDDYPFEILEKIILPEIHRKRPMEPLRVWSAACSCGQEPYSISMVIEAIIKIHPIHFVMGSHVVATDISEKALTEARHGEYNSILMNRGVPQTWRKVFFDELSNNNWRVKESVRKRVNFAFLNLMNDYSKIGMFDVIFCRNALVYFSAEVKVDILRRMHAALRPGGYLIVGAMEVLSGIQDYYQVIQCNPGVVYRAIEKS